MRLQAAVLLFLLTVPLWGARQKPELIQFYDGPHQEAFRLQWDRVRLLTGQAQLEASARLGLLQYREGFKSPLLIRFADEAPAGIENALAFVRAGQNEQGFYQELVINLKATARTSLEFDKVFLHEMTHAVLNDAFGGEASLKIPHWVQEGLAQYVAGEGPERLKLEAGQYKKSHVRAMLHPLDGPYAACAYTQYYLAIQAMEDLYSVNAVQAFVRNLIAGRSVSDSIEDSTGRSWEKFQDDVREHSLKILQDKARPDF